MSADELFTVSGPQEPDYQTDTDIRASFAREALDATPAALPFDTSESEAKDPQADFSSRVNTPPLEPPVPEASTPAPQASPPPPRRTDAYRALLRAKDRRQPYSHKAAEQMLQEAEGEGEAGYLASRSVYFSAVTLKAEAGASVRGATGTFHLGQYTIRGIKDVRSGAASTGQVVRGGLALVGRESLGTARQFSSGGAHFAATTIRDFRLGEDDVSATPTKIKDAAYTAAKSGFHVAQSFARFLSHPIAAFKALGSFLLAAGGWALVILLVLFAVLLLFTAFTSLKSQDADLNDAWLHITKLDAEFTANALLHEGADEFELYLNGQPIDPSGFEVQTDCLLFLSFLDAKYQDYTFSSVQAEIDRIFEDLYSCTKEVHTEERPLDPDEPPPPDGSQPASSAPPTTKTVRICTAQVTAIPLAQYLQENAAALFTSDQRSAMDALLEVGPTTFRQELASPFPGHDWQQNITSRFGWRIDPFKANLSCHKALDIAMPQGTPVYSVMEGEVITGTDASYGNFIKITDSQGNVTLYAHLSSFSEPVPQRVRVGQVIGYVGCTGAATGPHLHIEYRKGAAKLNPLFYLLNEPQSS